MRLFSFGHHHTKAIVLSIFAFIAFFMSDAMRKLLAQGQNIADILFWQAVIGMALIGVLAVFSKHRHLIFDRKTLKWQMSRGLLMATNTILSLVTISMIPILDAYTIFFLTPFVVTLAGAFLFKEHIGVYRICSIVMGFFGAFIAFRPGFEDISPAYITALCCVVAFSSSNLIARKIGHSSGLLAYAFWPFAFLSLFVGIYLRGHVAFPHDALFWVFVSVAALSYVLALLMISYSFSIAPAAVVAPYQYTQIVFAVIFGYLVFGEIPDFYKILGVLIISGSGVFLFARERYLRKKALKKEQE